MPCRSWPGGCATPSPSWAATRSPPVRWPTSGNLERDENMEPGATLTTARTGAEAAVIYMGAASMSCLIGSRGPGGDVHLLDEGDMTRLIYLAAVRLLKQNPDLADQQTLVSHIGPGNTRALY